MALRIATWNINGLAPNKLELELLISNHKLDVVLISEAHCTEKSNIKIKDCNTYITHHPDGTGHAGTAIIIRKHIKHHLLPEYKTNHIQATKIAVESKCGTFNLAAVYCPPKHAIDNIKFTTFFSTLEGRFVAGGDWNAKHTFWGSRLTTTRGRQLKASIDENNLYSISTGEPTYWPTDPKKKPDLIDFFVCKGISKHYVRAESCLDSNSDHTPAILTVSTTVICQEKPETLYTKFTDWESFRDDIEKSIKLKISLKTPEEIEDATRYITSLIQNACWRNTPEEKRKSTGSNLPLEIKQMVLEKRRLRRVWQQSRHKSDRTALNKAIRDLKEKLDDLNNTTLRTKLQNLTATASTEYSLWKFTKNLNRPQQSKSAIRKSNGAWARTSKEKANIFAQHLANVFTPNESQCAQHDQEVNDHLLQVLQLSPPLKPVAIRELVGTIKRLENHKAPGFDLITKEVLTQLPRKALVFLTTLLNGILRVQHFPCLWKISIITMMEKPGKPPDAVTSYRPISLLPVLSKVLEKILHSRMLPVLAENAAIPTHQFGFRKQHSTIEQVHRVCDKVRRSLEAKEYCSAVFLDIQQAFDKVWHKGLLSKIKTLLPHSFYMLMVSYLSDRMFQVREEEDTSEIHTITAGVPQGSVLGPVLYTMYTADLPETPDVTTATFADDTALLASSTNPVNASAVLQTSLDKIDDWLNKWRIKASVAKSVHITFTLRKGNCPPLLMGNSILPHSDSVKYLGLHLDRRLTWNKHIKTKRDEVNIRFRRMYWLMARNSKLSVDNKLLIYKAILKPVWMYGIQLWGSACNSSISIMQRLQNGILRTLSDAPWFITNTEIHEALAMKTVRDEIKLSTNTYKNRLSNHPNELATDLINISYHKRLKRHDIQRLDSRW